MVTVIFNPTLAFQQIRYFYIQPLFLINEETFIRESILSFVNLSQKNKINHDIRKLSNETYLSPVSFTLR